MTPEACTMFNGALPYSTAVLILATLLTVNSLLLIIVSTRR